MQPVTDDESRDEHGSYLTATDDQPRLRRPGDVMSMVVGLAFVVWGLLGFDAARPFEETLKQLVAALPEWAVALLGFGYSLGLIYAVVVVVTFVVKRRWLAIRDISLAALITALVTTLLVSSYGELWPPFFTEFVQGELRSQFPIIRVAIVTAILVASAPYLVRPVRRLGWAIVVMVGIAAVALALSVPSGVVVSVGVGLIAAAGIRLIFGSPMGYPDVAAVRAALTRMRIDTTQLDIDPDQLWGARRFVGTTSEGVDIAVKVYGRDATDSQVMAKVWHAIMYRSGSHRVTFTRVESVQQEALVTIMAGQAEISVPDVTVAAAPTDEVALLVTIRAGTLMADVDASLLDQDALTSLWKQVAAMHAAGVTHGSLGVDSVRVQKTGFEIVDFEKGSVVYQEPDACLDVATLLFDTAVKVGPEAAVKAAAAGLGTDRLAASLGYLQPPALSSRERHSTKGSSKLLKQLRKQVAAATGTKIPKPIKLRRFGWRDLLTIVVVVMFASALMSMLTGIDYAQVWDSIKNSNWWLVGLAMIVGQFVFLPQATAMKSAVARAIPLRPMTILQPAVAFISFAVPGVAGRAAMEASFLYKYGVSPTVSAVKAGVDGFAGFLVQITILILALLTGSLKLSQNSPDPTSSPDTNSGPWLIIAIVIVAVIAVVVVVLKNKKLHDRIVPQVKQGWQALTEVLRSPRRALGLLGSQLAVQLVWGLVMWLALLSLGVHLSLISCTAVVVGTALLSGFLPVPGGIGVSEAVITALLVPLGVSADVAVGTAVIWRLSTFYIPAVEGIFADKYLSKHGDL
jgi:uncharacterized membrane protein YbhN (UPF0104 family)/tRNA A-37 threonylcarbamoyl transferase component Bud32